MPINNRLIAVMVSLIIIALPNAIHATASCPSYTAPSGATAYVCIPLTNAQTTQLNANTPVMFAVNTLNYSAYTTADMQNVNFAWASGTAANTFLEGNLLNENQYTTLNTVNALGYWVNVPSNVAAGNTIYLFMNFYPTSTNKFNTYDTGIAPQIFCATGCTATHYAQYDDGNQVFLNGYWNFEGTSLPAGWTGSGYTVANGLTIASSVTAAYAITSAATYGDSANTLDWLGFQQGGATDNFMTGYLTSAGTTTGNNALGIGSIATQYNGNYLYGSQTTALAFSVADSKLAFSTTNTLFSVEWNSGSSANFSYGYGSLTALTSNVPAGQNSIGAYTGAVSGATDFVQYMRYRQNPPNDIMPEYSFGAVTSPFYTIMTFNTLITTGSVSNSITLTLPISGTASINWGDGSALDNSNTFSHVYATGGVYTVTIINNGGMTGFDYNNGGDKTKLITINQWGNIILGNNGGYFYGASNMNSIATDAPSLTGTTDLANMFQGDTAFNGNIANWNTNSVTTMAGMFSGASAFNQNIGAWNTNSVVYMNGMFYDDAAFNQPIGGWNTMSVTAMYNMFSGASAFNGNIANWNTNSVTSMFDMFNFDSAFNQPIGGWNTMSVTEMYGMFNSASAFNQPIGGWNTAKVTDMHIMFSGASAFNQNIGAWNTNSVVYMNSMFSGASAFNGNIGAWNTMSVTSMTGMFSGASAFNQNIGAWNTNSVTTMGAMFKSDPVFNQNIGAWNTIKVTDMSYMFQLDTAFNQNIGAWNVNSLTTATGMFSGVTLSIQNYDSLLDGWSASNPAPQNGVTFNGGNSKYTYTGLNGRNILTGTYKWTITDAGQAINTLVAIPNPYTMSNTIMDVGQTTIANTIISNAVYSVSSYTANWLWYAPNGNALTFSNTIISSLPTSNNALTLTISPVSSNSLLLTYNGVSYYANAIGTNTIYGTWTFNAFASDANGDTNPTPQLTNTITINPAISTPTILFPQSNGYDAGATLSIGASFTGGTSPYTYNYIISNSITNAIIYTTTVSNALAGNTIDISIPSSWIGNTIQANVIVTDSATTNSVANSVYSSSMQINQPLSSVSFTVSNLIADNGQYETISQSINGGTLPYSYSLSITNSITGAIIANSLAYNSVSTSNSLTTLLSGANANGNLNPVSSVNDSSSLPNSAATYNGASSSSYIPYNSVFNTNSFSISLWMNPSNTVPLQQIIFNRGNNNGGVAGWDILEQGGIPQLQISSGSTWGYAQGPAATVGKWVAITATYNGVDVSYYENGGLDTSFALGNFIPNNDANFYIGNTGYYYNGLLTNVQLYNSSLSSAQVSALYQEGISGVPISPANIVGWWALDGNMNDLSGNGHAATPSSVGYTANVISTISSSKPQFVEISSGNTITVNPILSAGAITPSTPSIDAAQSITLTANPNGGITPYSYQWYTGVGCNAAISGANTVTYSASPTSNTIYSYQVTDSASTPVSQCSLPYAVNSITSGINDPQAVAISPSGIYAYVTNLYSNNVVIINTASNTVTSGISFGISSGFNNPQAVAISPSGTYAYVGNGGSNNVVIIDTASNTVTGSITAGFNGIFALAFSPSGTYAYAVNFNANNVVIINTATNTVTGSITSGFNDPTGVAFSPSGTYAYVSNYNTENVVIINTATNTVTGSITSGFYGPFGIAFSPSGAYAYIINQPANNAVIVNTESNTVTASVSFTFNNAKGVAISPSGTYAYVTNYNSNNVVIINTPEIVSINPALSVPTLTSSPSLPATLTIGSTITFTTSWSGGTNTYTANYLITNTVTQSLVANMLFTGITGTSNSFAWTIPSNMIGNTIAANVFITDSATTPETTNSAKTGTMTVVSCPSSARLDVGQTVSCTASASGGALPYTYNWLISNSITNAITANMLFTGVSSTSNTFTYTTVSADTSNSPERFNVIITDNNGNTLNSISSSTFVINPAISTPAISPSNPSIDSGQSVTFTSTWSGGTPDYTAKLYSSTTSTCNTGSTLVQTLSFLTSGSASFSNVSPPSNTYYCVVVTDSATTPETTISSVSEVTLNPTLVAGIISPVPAYIDIGQNVILDATHPTGGTLPYVSYQWIESNGGRYYNATVASNTLTPFTFSTNALTQISTDKIVNTISANQGQDRWDVAFTNDGSEAFVTDFANNSVSVINVAANSVVKVIGGFSNPWGLATSPNGAEIYVANHGSDYVSVINVAANTISNSIYLPEVGNLGNGPSYVAFTPDGSEAFVSDYSSNCVSVINVAANTVVNTIIVGTSSGAFSADPFGIAVTPDGRKVYVALEENNPFMVRAIDVATNTVVNSILIHTPAGLAISPDGSMVYVTGSEGSTITSVINTATNTVTNTLTVPGYPMSLAFTPDGSEAYVTGEVPGTTSVVNVATNTVVSTLDTGSYSFGIAFTPDGSTAYVVSRALTTISVIRHFGYAFKLRVKDSSSINQITNSSLAVVNVNAAPTASGIDVTNSILDNGQSTTLNTTILNGTGPFTVNFIYTNNGMVANTISGVSTNSTVKFTFTPASAGTYTFNAIVTDTGTVTPFVFAAESNTITVYQTPTVSISPANSIVRQFIEAYYAGSVPSGSGAGPFTLRLLYSNGTIASTNTIPIGGGVAILPYVSVRSGPQSFNIIATDTGTTTPLTFSSPSNTVNVVSTAINASSLAPNGIMLEVPIVLTNLQSSPYPANAQVMVTFNALAYNNLQTYEAPNLQNIAFIYANGTSIPAWLEGNLLNISDSNDLSTTANDIYWLRIAPSDKFLGAYSSNTIYMIFASTSKNLYANSMAQIGESPLLSNTYAQYDNGANVFGYYQAWGGLSALPSGWSVINGGNPSTLTFNPANIVFTSALVVSSEGIYKIMPSAAATPSIIDTYSKYYGSLCPTEGGLYTSNTLSNAYLAVGIDNGQSALTSGSYCSANYGSVPPSPTGIYSSINPSSNRGSMLFNYSDVSLDNITLSGTPAYLGYVGIYGGYFSLYWTMARAYPPNGKMITVTFEPGYQLPMVNAPKVSNAIADQNQYESFNGTIIGGTSPYNAVLYVSNAVTHSVIYTANAVFLTPSWSFNGVPATANWVTNSPLTTNIVIIDSTQATANSVYASNFIVNSPQSAGVLSAAPNAINVGQSTTLTARPSGGTPPYAISWFAHANCAGSVVGSGASTILFPSSTTTYSYNSVDSASTANSVCSQSNTTEVYASPSAGYGSNSGGTVATTSPTISGIQNGYIIQGVTAPGSFNLTLDGVRLNFTIKSVTSAGAEVTVNGNKYVLYPNENATISQFQNINYSFYTRLNFSSLSQRNGVVLEVFAFTKRVQINATTGNFTYEITTYNSIPTTINLPHANGTLNITSSFTINQILSVTNLESSISIPPLPSNYTEQLIQNISIRPVNTGQYPKVNTIINIKLRFNCSIPPYRLALFTLINNSWQKINAPTINAKACTVIFALSGDPIIALAKYVGYPLNSNSSTTSVPVLTTYSSNSSNSTSPQRYGNTSGILQTLNAYRYYLISIAIVLSVIIYLIIYSRRRGKNQRKAE